MKPYSTAVFFFTGTSPRALASASLSWKKPGAAGEAGYLAPWNPGKCSRDVCGCARNGVRVLLPVGFLFLLASKQPHIECIQLSPSATLQLSKTLTANFIMITPLMRCRKTQRRASRYVLAANVHQPGAHPLAACRAHLQRPARLRRRPCAAALPAAAAPRRPPLPHWPWMPGQRTSFTFLGIRASHCRHPSTMSTDTDVPPCPHYLWVGPRQ